LNAEVVNSTAYFFTHFNKSGDQYLGTAFGTDGGVDPAFHEGTPLSYPEIFRNFSLLKTSEKTVVYAYTWNPFTGK